MSQSLEGGCHCGAVRYRVSGTPAHAALCHCTDCRRAAGAPVVHWAAFAEADVALLQGAPRDRRSSAGTTRSFCPDCGTGLFYRNPQALPGLVDVQAATLDDPEALPPQCHVQTAERIGWMADIGALPAFARFPGAGEG
jgi:hypothetical protein